jgi:Na+/H+ antiporter
MHTVTIVLMFLFAVVISAFLARLLPIKIPLPLLQIAIGAALSWFGFPVVLDPHVFLLLFIPPLLFLDGWRIPKGAFFRDWKSILSLAIGLVIFTVIGMGFFVHWLVPAVPLAVAFALAAILSPTDPVAVSAITANSPVPSRLMHILEGESLLNDATGLVCFSFAVAAALTGTFTLGSAATSFALVAGGGVAVGIGMSWMIGQLNRLLVSRTGEDPATQILISLLTPFVTYLAAEHLHVSGILAAAVAGIAMHYAELSGRVLAATRMQRRAVWDMVQTALNGIIFVLLGEQLPGMLRTLPRVAEEAHVANPWYLLGLIVAITVALGALRFLWVWVTMALTVVWAKRRGRDRIMPDTRVLAITATAGVRGAITLAGILSLPLLMPDDSAFPARDLVIFLAMGVILLSLTVASIGLPLLTRHIKEELMQPVSGSNEASARVAATEAAIRRLEAAAIEPTNAVNTNVRAEAMSRVLDVYRRRLDYGDRSGEHAGDIRLLAQAEQHLRLLALRAERDELYRLRLSHIIDDDVHVRLVREIDLLEESLVGMPGH